MTRRIEHARVLGLLGGMGPAATVDILDKIVRATPASVDQEHLPVLVRCVPQIPDRSTALAGQGHSPCNALVHGATELRRWGADVLVMACNTAHYWYQPVSVAFGGPVVHIAEAVTQMLEATDVTGPVGLMATGGTIHSGIYQRRLEAAGYSVLLPSPTEQTGLVDQAVAKAKAGEWHTARALARYAADRLLQRGAARVVLACSELPVALAPTSSDDRLVDANTALAQASVRAILCHKPVIAQRALCSE